MKSVKFTPISDSNKRTLGLFIKIDAKVRDCRKKNVLKIQVRDKFVLYQLFIGWKPGKL